MYTGQKVLINHDKPVWQVVGFDSRSVLLGKNKQRKRFYIGTLPSCSKRGYVRCYFKTEALAVKFDHMQHGVSITDLNGYEIFPGLSVDAM